MGLHPNSQWIGSFFLASLLFGNGGLLQERRSDWPPIKENVQNQAEKVMDILFPRTFGVQHNILIVARFFPPVGPESQFVVYGEGDQCCEVILARGLKNIHAEVVRMVGGGIKDEHVIAKNIEVDVQRLQIPRSVVEGWLSSFLGLNFTLESSGFHTVDGVLAELWYEGPDRMRIHFSYVDPFEGDDKKSHPLVRWMNQVKAEIEKYASPIRTSP